MWFVSVRGKLFHSLNNFVCNPIDSLKEFTERLVVEKELILRLNLFHSKARLLEAAEKWIDMRAPKKRGRPTAKKWATNMSSR